MSDVPSTSQKRPRPVDELNVDFADEAYQRDPYPTLARLREAGPIHPHRTSVWLVTRYSDITAILKDARLSNDPRRWTPYPLVRPYLAGSKLEEIVERWMQNCDPPLHTRLRRLMSRALAPPQMAALEDHIRAVVDRCIERIGDTDSFDVVAALARPLPMSIVSEMFGLPLSDADRLAAWSDVLPWVFEPHAPLARRQEMGKVASEMVDYMQAHVDQRRRAPQNDMLQTLLDTADNGEQLTNLELVANLVFLFVAAHETVTQVISQGLRAFATRPDAYARLRENPKLLDTAVEEVVRFEPPISLIARQVKDPLEIGGQALRAGEMVFLMVGSANRDAAVFASPDTFDIERKPNPHIGFGVGSHFCLGAPLGRLEARIAFERVLARWQTIELAAEPVFRGLGNMRGLQKLELRVTRA